MRYELRSALALCHRSRRITVHTPASVGFLPRHTRSLMTKANQTPTIPDDIPFLSWNGAISSAATLPPASHRVGISPPTPKQQRRHSPLPVSTLTISPISSVSITIVPFVSGDTSIARRVRSRRAAACGPRGRPHVVVGHVPRWSGQVFSLPGRCRSTRPGAFRWPAMPGPRGTASAGHSCPDCPDRRASPANWETCSLL